MASLIFEFYVDLRIFKSVYSPTSPQALIVLTTSCLSMDPSLSKLINIGSAPPFQIIENILLSAAKEVIFFL